MNSICFFEPNIDSCLASLESIEFLDAGKVILTNWNDFSEKLVKKANKKLQFVCLKDSDIKFPWRVKKVNEVEPQDVILVNQFVAEELSNELMQYINSKNARLLAPITEHYYKNRSLFLVSIPKSGTHLLYKLVELLGYSPGVVHNNNPAPGSWYCVEYSNSHTAAKDFFIDSVRKAPFGNKAHPFPITPTLFIYRNPLDIWVSEANYYHLEDATVFSSYLKHLSFDERLMRLLSDPHLLGTIRDRINNFVPWFDFENVIPLSFEELVGKRGGGDDNLMHRLIWSIQLKLHVPGKPENFAQNLFDINSPTFKGGQIGAAKSQLTSEAINEFFRLDLDFMYATGYLNKSVQLDDKNGIIQKVNLFSNKVDIYINRPLSIMKSNFGNIPFNVEWMFLGHNIVKFNHRYYALSIDAGPIDLVQMKKNNQLENLMSASSLQSIKAKVISQSMRVVAHI